MLRDTWLKPSFCVSLVHDLPPSPDPVGIRRTGKVVAIKIQDFNSLAAIATTFMSWVKVSSTDRSDFSPVNCVTSVSKNESQFRMRLCAKLFTGWYAR